MKINILGVKIDKINQSEALKQIERWIWNPGKHYIVTPNLEFILAAQKDLEFKQILNKADLSIPDSSSLGFSYWLLKRKYWERLILWPLFFVPLKQLIQFDRVSGTDLMDALCKLSAEKGFVTGFLGGQGKVAKRCAECLQKKYPKLKIAFAESGGEINRNGNMTADCRLPTTVEDGSLKPVDLLFVAFGHIKQEKWIDNNLDKIPVRVAIGVGGAFDYLSASVPRAPKVLRKLGFEWLFRLMIQPWRLKRQLALLKYLWLLTRAG
ncbi:MAG: Glycosyl transferase, WecB/TagA/CpsF family [Candidatus Daviesbacteria bacterium GW2011_GWB1_39_5]|uniref:Glycosyl transferase, WecB/TagA/CpsF family n=1 Tax=Candidatus Daviesbacteria bacterium GW2011_GWC2_40_12 TaxID=1618431 RepID=A0A0G0T1H2_9BACT|nr:MAG: Glycosyl transferase, WecB/TagA/CpsF family [Candidatus Daviesbacteria bacterium GW2011_GWF2_38_7]KKR16499.1 MAG: Glycosyl transferase, WecB/TagA/CpsF family [Candidatus Daviesbacteria bacterium GW2011_GWA2_39_33]KKR23327.1 MAG: Glycosyl transferase, WecB/TagA/CpsF family [Candidatus Daviesbacteria bacterium GW2011_GWB1_39_5]KKR40950.1 MAG: Glycosyl transferase, WecB/TagA/CpsF family [Candidatus Daviesbacteria bacterium GW2011_GWC2_40_12]OGE21450.1 MAG: hypothetical protein A2778_01010 